MKLETIIKILELVAPLAGVDSAKLKVVMAILEILKEESK